MAISVALRAAIFEAVHGKPGELGHLRNFKKTLDGAGTGGASLATKMFADTKTYAASGTEDLDLSGALVGIDGAAAVFTKVHSIYVKAAATNTNKVNIGGASANQFVGPFANASDIVQVAPGDSFLVTNDAGWDVTAATADLLKLANAGSGTGVTFDIIITGV